MCSCNSSQRMGLVSSTAAWTINEVDVVNRSLEYDAIQLR